MCYYRDDIRPITDVCANASDVAMHVSTHGHQQLWFNSFEDRKMAFFDTKHSFSQRNTSHFMRHLTRVLRPIKLVNHQQKSVFDSFLHSQQNVRGIFSVTIRSSTFMSLNQHKNEFLHFAYFSSDLNPT